MGSQENSIGEGVIRCCPQSIKQNGKDCLNRLQFSSSIGIKEFCENFKHLGILAVTNVLMGNGVN